MFSLVALFVLIEVGIYTAYDMPRSALLFRKFSLHLPPSWVHDPINIKVVRLHRCRWRMFKTKFVGDGTNIDVINSVTNSVTNIHKSSPFLSRRHHDFGLRYRTHVKMQSHYKTLQTGLNIRPIFIDKHKQITSPAGYLNSFVPMNS